jgi:glucosyl-dolichyl phosphate glucuronosyltransferase
VNISVIICAYTEERWGDLLASVHSVRQQTAPPAEILVVIDHNRSLLRRARQELRGVVVIENAGSRGLSGARNSGLAAASGQVLAFLDDDATAHPDWLRRLGAGYQDPKVLGVGGAIEPLWLAGRPAWFPEEFDWVVGCTYRGMPEQPAPVRNLIGCNMSLRHEVFEGVGGFLDGVGRIGTRPLGCEETELCIRARRHWPEGLFVYEPLARVSHRVPSSRAEFRYFVARCLAEGHSKAVVAHLAGSRPGLATERTYVLRTLPKGVIRGLKATTMGGDPAGWRRSAAILCGLAFTSAGYIDAARQRSRQSAPVL